MPAEELYEWNASEQFHEHKLQSTAEPLLVMMSVSLDRSRRHLHLKAATGNHDLNITT